MQCRVCGSQIPLGASACPVCGTPVAQQGENNPGQIAPTVYSPQPGQAPTTYGASSFDQPPPPNPYQQSGDQYASPSSYNQTDPTRYAPPPNPSYNQPNYNQPNYNQPNYNQPNYNQPNQQGYGQPPAPSNFNNNQYGNNVPPYAPIPGQQYGGPQQPRRRSPWLWIILGIVAVVILACVGGTYALAKIGSSAAQTKSATPTTAQATPTTGDSQAVPTSTQATPTTGSNTTNTGSTPSGDPIDSAAAQIITDPQTATAVNSTTAEAQPGSVTSSFTTNQVIYVVFKLNLANVDLNTQTLYVSARFYADGIKMFTAKPLKLIQTTGGYFGAQYSTATQQGAAELVLCQQANCSDAKVGQVVQFTVSD